MRRRAILTLTLASLLLTGCTASGDSAGSADPAASTSATPSPSASRTPAESPAPSETAAPAPQFGAFTRQQLIDNCVRLESELVGSEYLTLAVDQTRIEQRQVAPEWFVYIPGTNSNGEVVMNCILGGTPEAVEYATVGGTLPLTESEIQALLASNDMFQE